MKRALAMILAILMLLFTLASCNITVTPAESGEEGSETETLEDTKKDETASGTETAKPTETTQATEAPTATDATEAPAATDAKKIPVYQGMSVVNNLDQAKTLMSNGITLLSNYYGGDVNQKDPWGKGEDGPKLEDKVKDHFKDHNKGDSDGEGSTAGDDLGADSAEDVYYSKKNSDVYILIHIDNPDQYEIISFTLNGKKYANNMFEDGSDLETLILKVTIGDVTETQVYTIDAIKYVDGIDIKDVKMEGDKTVKVIIAPDEPVVTITEEVIDDTSITVTINVVDDNKLIENSKGEIYLILYDGESIIKYTECQIDMPAVIDEITEENIYQYAIVATYDALDGTGMMPHILFKKAIKIVGGLTTILLPVSGVLSVKHDPDTQVFNPSMNAFMAHSGVDLIAQEGAPVYSAASGTISKIWVDPLMGYCISITHSGNCVTIYKNLSEGLPNDIVEGAYVTAGQQISWVGESAIAEVHVGPHLHFEITVEGLAVDPLEYLSEEMLETIEAEKVS